MMERRGVVAFPPRRDENSRSTPSSGREGVGTANIFFSSIPPVPSLPLSLPFFFLTSFWMAFLFDVKKQRKQSVSTTSISCCCCCFSFFCFFASQLFPMEWRRTSASAATRCLYTYPSTDALRKSFTPSPPIRLAVSRRSMR